MSTTQDNPDNAPAAAGRLTKTLARHTAATDGWAMFCPVIAPAFAGNAQPGIDWCCRGCATVLAVAVAVAVYEGQFLDVLFRCPACGLVGAPPTRRPGRPLAGRPVLAPPGRYRLGSAVDLVDKPVMTVGQQALDGYLTETGRSISGTATHAVPTAITPAGLRALASQAKDLLGEEYTALQAADRRAQASPTPPLRRHRLIDLIAFAEDTATAIETSGDTATTTVDANRLAELVGTVAMFARWRNHPAWPELVHSLSTQTEGQHALMLLVIASYLVDAGNGVGIVPNGGKGRIPDIWVEPSLVERLHLEVKTPQALRGPSATHITGPEADNLVERILKKAASTARSPLLRHRRHRRLPPPSGCSGLPG